MKIEKNKKSKPIVVKQKKGLSQTKYKLNTLHIQVQCATALCDDSRKEKEIIIKQKNESGCMK